MAVVVRPLPPPSAVDRADAARAQAELALEPGRIQRAAENWRTGLAGVLALTLATTALSSRDDLGKLAPGWRWVIVGCALVSIAASVAGLDRLLRAAYGAPRWERRAASVPTEVSDRASLRDSAAYLRRGRLLSYAAVALFVAAVLVQRVAPGAATTPTLSVVGRDGHSVCGTVTQSGDGAVTVKDDAGVEVTLRLADLRSVMPGGC